jgi:UDP-N-acetylmuramoyl-L-alanyl-D-glutamate--2,6-diaminopimelate ligase
MQGLETLKAHGDRTRAPRLRLADLVAAIGPSEVLRRRDCEVTGVADHSAAVEPGNVFFAVPGCRDDGARYAAQAIGRGAVAVVADRPLSLPVTCCVVPDVRRAASRAADRWFGSPSRQMTVVGVTGTNGKTTVAELIRICLEDDARPAGSLGTVEYRLGPTSGSKGDEMGDVIVPSHNTTPGPIAIQSCLRQMLDRGARAAVLEVSSHALDQGRVEAIHFTAAVFTNLTQDHLDYHGTMERYAMAKARLFAALGRGAVAVLPAEGPGAAAMRAAVPAGLPLATWSLGKRRDSLPDTGVHVRGEILAADARGTRLLATTRQGDVDFLLPLVGRHNVRNALAAMTCALSLGVGHLRAAGALGRARPVRGRLQRIDDRGRGFDVFVDYAHTPDALEQVLGSLRTMARGRLRVVFGCGGERDAKKRPIMGRIAAELADHVVLTWDNPRSEDPESILGQIVAGVRSAGEHRAQVEVVPDRGRAIRRALESAEPGDVVVIAGKGHETGQQVGQAVLPFDDTRIAEEWLCCR